MPELTEDDWTEIYYALEYKLTSSAVQGSDQESLYRQAHLNDILEKIGQDGENMY